MARKRITYGDIKQLFQAEGFEEKSFDKPHALFEQRGGRAALILPRKSAGTPAAPLHIAMVRHTMIDFGVMTPSEFDRWTIDPKHFQAA